MALGKFSLNLSGCPRERGSDFVGHLGNLISCLVTKVSVSSRFKFLWFYALTSEVINTSSHESNKCIAFMSSARLATPTYETTKRPDCVV
jgi:hypothetical protein